jgi:hypothetical protein
MLVFLILILIISKGRVYTNIIKTTKMAIGIRIRNSSNLFQITAFLAELNIFLRLKYLHVPQLEHQP